MINSIALGLALLANAYFLLANLSKDSFYVGEAGALAIIYFGLSVFLCIVGWSKRGFAIFIVSNLLISFTLQMRL